MSLSLAVLESGPRLDSTCSNAKMVNECEYVPLCDTYTHTHTHREKCTNALFVQTINDVAQGQNAQFARISIVITTNTVTLLILILIIIIVIIIIE